MYQQLLSADIRTRANAIKDVINQDSNSPLKERMREGNRYYNYEHDILNVRLFYFDSTGILREEKHRSNETIPHTFFSELVDQKVQYLLSEPVEFDAGDEGFQSHLDEYINEEFQLLLQELVEGASIKAKEFIYPHVDGEGRLGFQVADSLTLAPVYGLNNEIVAFVRYYGSEILKDGKVMQVTRAELWTNESVEYFVTDDKGDYHLDTLQEINPRPHLLMRNSRTGELKGKGWGFLPFFELRNNKAGKTDLEPIKRLIDDYDLMASSLSNNLQDFQEALYVVKGFQGDNLDHLTQNIKTRKTVGVSEGGDVEVREVNIPYQARKAKLDLDKEGIYKFGMGFDSNLIGDGNITNVVIQSRYSLLDLKTTKTEIRLRKLLRDLLAMIVDDINARNGTSYNAADIEITITRSAIVNNRDDILNEKDKESTRQTLIENILASAPRIGDDEALRLLCEAWDISFEEIQEALVGQDYLFPGESDE